MIVRFSPRARRRARYITTWWRENRPDAPTLFDEELAVAIDAIRQQPMAGMVYPSLAHVGMRRVLLPKSEQHVYFVVHENDGVIVIHTVWGRAAWPRPESVAITDRPRRRWSALFDIDKAKDHRGVRRVTPRA